MILQLAYLSDAQAISNLLNDAYRGSQGWTTEGHLVSGNRIDLMGTQLVIEDKNSDFLVLHRDIELIACICVQYKANQAYIGSFAVAPEYQTEGLGKKVLLAAEQHAKKRIGITEYAMVVIEDRLELIAYYERRGYQRTGQVEPYPVAANSGLPTKKHLNIVHLIKPVESS